MRPLMATRISITASRCRCSGDAQGAARAYQRALTFKPDLVAADFNLGVLFQQQANTHAAIAAYSNVLAADPRHAAAYKNLGEVLLAAGQIDGWLANFRAFERHCPKALPLAVYALEACQHLADFARLERYIDGLRQEEFQARDEEELVDCLEELLYLLAVLRCRARVAAALCARVRRGRGACLRHADGETRRCADPGCCASAICPPICAIT